MKMASNNTQELNFVLNTICEGCLSSDRRTTLINDDESKSLFCDMIADVDYLNNSVLLCWECRAIIRKILNFRKQVKDAHQLLIRCMIQPTTLTPLTHLTTQINTTTTQLTNQKQLKTDLQNCKLGNENGDEKSEPLTFVKVEDAVQINDDFYMNCDEWCTGDDLAISCNLEEEKPSSRTFQKTPDDFNESDEEPLKNKKRDGVKGRGKRRCDDVLKTDGRKRPAPKREKAPGVVNNSRVEKKLRQLNVTSGQIEMVVLSWEEVDEEKRQALSSEAFTRHSYKCHDCALGFNHKFKLEKHMEKHSACSGEHVCGVCRVRCRDGRALAAHRRRHRVRWRCCLCGAMCSRAGVAADHYARTHRGPAPTHTCNVCGHCEPSLSKLRIHIKSHSERQKCELCGKTFRDKTSLRTHLFIHKGEKEYSCPRCEKRFLFKKAMEVHLVTHDAPAHLYCLQCDMNFKNKMSYYQHMKYNLKHIDPAKLKYTCSLCDKKFSKAARLAEHCRAIHERSTPVRCNEQGCHFVCSTRPVLRTHMRMIHRNGRTLRNHVCDTCGKAYTTKKTLEGHMRTHTGERPFSCSLCPSTFGYEAALYNHNKLVHLKAKTGRSRPPIPATEWTLPNNDTTVDHS